jgi:acyl-CoA synthetase (NDP forming)
MEWAMRMIEEQELSDLDKLVEYMDKYQKPIIISNQISDSMKNSRVFGKLMDNGIVMYPTPERAVKVLAHLVQYSRYLNEA